MKKVLAIAVCSILISIPTLKAQVFLGGGFSVNSSSVKYISGSTTDDGTKSFSFSLYPKMGYFLSDNLAVGAGIGLFTSKTTNPDYYEGDDVITKNTGWSIDPFVRYYLVKNGPFSMFGEGYLSLGGSKQKQTVGSTTNEMYNSFSFYAGVGPVVSYDISEKFSLEAGFGNLQYGRTVYKDPDDEDSKEIYTSVGLNVGLDDLYLGMIYKLK